MTPERWARLEDLFHAARDRAPDARAAFLASACAGDDALRREVESLLAQEEGTLLREGAGVAAAALVGACTHASHEGLTLGPYVLGPLLGRGGMGDVYRARDGALGRDVAVKILPDTLARHPDRLARFEREARILAALNHPHIGAIYGVEEHDGIRGLVLELVEGVTLKERIDAGALEVPEALALARQVAAALEAAHQKGITHRDLKPANIKVAPRGTVKVLDFGVAKIEEPAAPGDAGLPPLATADGVILGTVAYMSPEQARGLAIDKRTDIWAFGCVLYEMLTGARAFSGDTSTDVLGAILAKEPDWTRLPDSTPLRVRDLLRRCLTKDADRRLHDIADARIEIDDALERPADPVEAPRAAWRQPRLAAVWTLAGVAVLATAAAVWFGAFAAPERRDIARLAIPLPADVSVFAIGRGSSVAVSPDGRLVAFVGIANGSRRLYARPINGHETVPIAGTEGATSPFFSPDGRWIAFVDDTPAGTLKRVPVEGGNATTIVDPAGDSLHGFRVQGAAWASDDTIVFAAVGPRSGLWRVAASGGTPERLTTRGEGELIHTWPQIVSGRNAVIYTIWNNTGFEGGRIAVQSLAGGEPRVLVQGASYGRVVLADRRRAWLVFARADGLHAAPFDLDALQMAGGSIPVLSGVLSNLSGGANFSVSDDGLLAYVPGGLDELLKTLLWVGKDGAESTIGTIPGVGFQFRLSPDGRRIVRPDAGGSSRDLWIDDLEGKEPPLPLTFGGHYNAPIWTPDGKRVIYASGISNANLFWRAVDGTGEERLTTSPNSQTPGSVSRDGTTLAYAEAGPERSMDIWLLPLREPGQPRLLVSTPAADLKPMISPDGRWLAYQSNVSRRFEIYLASLGKGPRQVPISKGGGLSPMWSPDGRELYYRSANPEVAAGHMMAVSIDLSGPVPVIGTPRALFASRYQGDGDIGKDGRFLLLERTRPNAPTPVIGLVFNWFDELQAKVPRR